VIRLERRDAEAFHAAQIAEFGGLAGLRDAGAPESALAAGEMTEARLAKWFAANA
jgi:hypothetical protein